MGEPPYTAASRLYQALCLIELGQAKQAVNAGAPKAEPASGGGSPNAFFGVPIDEAPPGDAAGNPFAVPEMPRHIHGLDYLGVPIDAVTETPALTPEARRQVDQSLRLFDHLAGHAQGERVEAAWRCGRSLALLGRYADALDAFNFAQHTLRAAYISDLPDHLKPVARGLAEDRRKVAYLHDMTRYGLEFLLYRAAQEHRLAGRHEKAVAGYERCIDSAQDTMTRLLVAKLSTDFNADTPEGRKQIAVDESPYTAASRLYQALCLIELGQAKQAVKQLEAFVDEDPATRLPTPDELAAREATLLEDQEISDAPGLYRGQALLELGRIALEHELDVDRAQGYFERLNHWIVATRADNQDWQFNQVIPGITQAAKHKTDGPAIEYQKPDFWGNVKKTRIDPGMLVNRKTTRWYLDDIEEDSAKFLGFIYFARNDSERAITNWERLIHLDSSINDGDLSTTANDFTRLRFGAENAYLIAYPSELKVYSKRMRTAVLLGDFYYVTREWDRAEAQYSRILQSHYGKLPAPQRGYPSFALGNVAYWQGDASKSITIMKKVVSDEKVATFTQARAAYAIGNILANGGSNDQMQEGIRWWERLVKNDLRNEYTAKARISLAIKWHESGDSEKALSVLSGVEGHGQPWEDIARFYMQEFDR